MSTGRVRIDPHVKILDEHVVARAKARGLDGLVYAPHFTRLEEIQRQAAAFSDDELTVYPARELFTGSWRHRRHLLAVGLTAPVPDFITLEGAIAELRRQDATVLVPHPNFFTVSLTPAEIDRFSEHLHALEVYNSKHWPRHNRHARSLASDHAMPTFASSYAHLRGTVGEVWTAVAADIPDVAALGRAIRDPTIDREIGHRDGLGHDVRRGLEFAHLGWENSWKKFDRVVLSGPESTHPHNPAYDGQFDDVAVY